MQPVAVESEFWPAQSPNYFYTAYNKTSWTWNKPGSTVPLGMIYPSAADVSSVEWAGVATDSIIFNPAGYLTQTFDVWLLACTVGYLVSPKPQWQLAAPSHLGAGQADQVRIRVAYPDGEPVVGLRIRLRAETHDVAFGAGGAYSLEVVTDNSGKANIPIRAVSTGASAIRVELADERCAPEFFSPPFFAVVPVNADTINVGGNTCVVLPGVAAVPAVPATRVENPTYAWDSGANSEQALQGDVALQFSGAQALVGAVVGLTDKRADVPSPSRIAHGWYLHTNGITPVAQAYEGGKVVSREEPYTPETVFRVERRGANIAYLFGGKVIRRATSTLHNEVSVGASLFGANDFVFEAAEGGGGGGGGGARVAVVNGFGDGGCCGVFRIRDGFVAESSIPEVEEMLNTLPASSFFIEAFADVEDPLALGGVIPEGVVSSMVETGPFVFDDYYDGGYVVRNYTDGAAFGPGWYVLRIGSPQGPFYACCRMGAGT